MTPSVIPKLRLSGVAHTYRSARGQSVEALARMDLDIDEGSFVAVVGPSGCGKSTLLEVIAGLRRPTEGEVSLDGALVIGPGRRRGLVFQDSASLMPWLSVAGNVELGLRTAHLPKAQRSARVAAELERVGLADVADRAIYELSGGMQQRVQIARALASDPEVLLLDEPFGALDAFTREYLQDELRSIWKSTGKTIVFVTHSVEEAALLATRVIVLAPRPGRIVVDRPAGFTLRDDTAIALRADPEFATFTSRLRLAIGSSPHLGESGLAWD